MTQNFIQPKGSLNTKIDTSNLQNQLAQMFANQQLQGQAQAQAQTTNSTRQTLQDYLNNKLMQDVEMPKFTTIQDIFNAPKGEKLKTFGSYLNTPTGQNALGSILSLVSGGKYFTTPNDTYNQYLQNDMATRQAQAMQQMKEQNDIATALNNSYMQQDIANERNKLQRELAEQEIQLKREEMEARRQEKAADRAQQMQMLNMRLNGLGGGTATGGAAGLTPKQIQKNQEALNSLNAVQSQMDRFSKSFSDVRGSKAGALLANAYASKGFGNKAEANFNAQRTLLFNKIARELGGEKGVLSDQDIKRIEASLPALSDSYDQKKAKMQAIYDLLDDRKSQYGGAVSAGMASQMNSQPITVGGYTIEME